MQVALSLYLHEIDCYKLKQHRGQGSGFEKKKFEIFIGGAVASKSEAFLACNEQHRSKR